MTRFSLVAVACLLASPAAAQPKPDIGELEEKAFKQAASLVNPSIVRIQTVSGIDRVGKVLVGTGPTTGVVVSADGYVISSAFNFVAKPAAILIQLPDGRRFNAKVIANDKARMLTLLKIDAKGLTPAKAAKKADIKVGHWSIALGRTYSNLLPNMSVGIISAKNRVFGKALQSDAKISPANYGGPLVSIKGEVQGIIVPLSTRGKGETAGVEWYDGGIGFAIPMEDIYARVETLKKGKDLLPGLLGVGFRSRNALEGKAVLGRVRKNSPAEKAGFKIGDEIVQIDDAKIARLAEVKQALGGKYAGDKIKVTVKRAGKDITQEVTLVGSLTAYVAPDLGVLPMREGDKKGVVVRHVFAGSPAARAGLKPLDRITDFEGDAVANADELRKAVSRQAPGTNVKITYERGGKSSDITVTLGTLTGDFPAKLANPVLPPKKAGEKVPKTGRFTVEMPAHEHEYWAYVPEDYTPKTSWGLMVWVHPGGDTMEAAMFKQFKRFCQRRGIILLGPKAEKIEGWQLNEAEFIKDAIGDLRGKYAIDPERIFIHSMEDSAPFAFHIAFKYRDQFRGIAIIGGLPNANREEPAADDRLQIFIASGKGDTNATRVKAAATGLKTRKFPVATRDFKDASEDYPTESSADAVATWADCLDRI